MMHDCAHPSLFFATARVSGRVQLVHPSCQCACSAAVARGQHLIICGTSNARRPEVRRRRVHASASKASATSAPYSPKSATDAVETGTKCFEKEDFTEALRLYNTAMDMRPNDDEARAATYNAACVYVKQKKWQKAVDSLKASVNDYGLKVRVIYEDKDLRPLRERREWLDIQDELKGTVKASTKASLRAEAKQPFRLTRTFIFGGLGAAAALALLITATRLAALTAKGGDSPELQATIQNFLVDLAGVGVFGFLLRREFNTKRSAESIVEQEEALGRLQIQLSADRVVPLSRLRGTRRPLVIAGSAGFLNKCQKEVKRFRADLQDRGVCLVLVKLSEKDPESAIEALKKDPAFNKTPAKGFASTSDGSSSSGAAAPVQASDKKWIVPIANSLEWQLWVKNVRKEKSLGDSDVYIQVQLDGSVRYSGAGAPPFMKLISDTPPLDSIRTNFVDGVGPQEE